MFFYVLAYFLFGVALMGIVHLRRWFLTRKHRRRDSFLTDVLLIPVTAWFWPFCLYLGWKHGLPVYKDYSSNPEVLAVERRAKNREEFLRKMPYCSAVVRMDVSAFPHNLDSVGVLYLESEALWREISARVAKHPHLARDDEGFLLAWLATRELNDPSPCDAPIAFPRLDVSADVLVRQFHGQAECKLCGAVYPVQKLTYCDEFGRPTSNYNEIQCPQGHKLLKRLRMRFIRTSSRR